MCVCVCITSIANMPGIHFTESLLSVCVCVMCRTEKWYFFPEFTLIVSWHPFYHHFITKWYVFYRCHHHIHIQKLLSFYIFIYVFFWYIRMFFFSHKTHNKTCNVVIKKSFSYNFPLLQLHFFYIYCAFFVIGELKSRLIIFVHNFLTFFFMVQVLVHQTNFFMKCPFISKNNWEREKKKSQVIQWYLPTLSTTHFQWYDAIVSKLIHFFKKNRKLCHFSHS